MDLPLAQVARHGQMARRVDWIKYRNMNSTEKLKENARRFIAWCRPNSLADLLQIAGAAIGTVVFVHGLWPDTLGVLQPLLPLFALAFFAYLLWAMVLIRNLFFPSQTAGSQPLVLSTSAMQPAIPAKPGPDVWLRDAVYYCVLREWVGDGGQVALKGAQHQEAADYLKEIRQLARNGDIIIWGKRWENSTYDPLLADYWARYEVEYLELHRDSAEDVRTDTATPEGKDGTSYKGLRVSKLQFEQRWPATSGLVPLWQAARLVYEKTHAADMYSHANLDGAITYQCIALILDGRSKDPPIWGVRPPLEVVEVVPPSALANTVLMKNNYSHIERANQEGYTEWDRLSVRLEDLDPHIARQQDAVRQHRAKGGKITGDA